MVGLEAESLWNRQGTENEICWQYKDGERCWAWRQGCTILLVIISRFDGQARLCYELRKCTRAGKQRWPSCGQLAYAGMRVVRGSGGEGAVNGSVSFGRAAAV